MAALEEEGNLAGDGVELELGEGLLEGGQQVVARAERVGRDVVDGRLDFGHGVLGGEGREGGVGHELRAARVIPAEESELVVAEGTAQGKEERARIVLLVAQGVLEEDSQRQRGRGLRQGDRQADVLGLGDERGEQVAAEDGLGLVAGVALAGVGGGLGGGLFTLGRGGRCRRGGGLEAVDRLGGHRLLPGLDGLGLGVRFEGAQVVALGHPDLGGELGHAVAVAVVVRGTDPLAGEGALGHAREGARGRFARLLGDIEEVFQVAGQEVLGNLGLAQRHQTAVLAAPEGDIGVGLSLQAHQAGLRVFQEHRDELLDRVGHVRALQRLDNRAQALLVGQDADLGVQRLDRLAALEAPALAALGALTALGAFAAEGTLAPAGSPLGALAAEGALRASTLAVVGTVAAEGAVGALGTLFAAGALVVVLALVAAGILVSGLTGPIGGEVEAEVLGVVCVAHCARSFRPDLGRRRRGGHRPGAGVFDGPTGWSSRQRRCCWKGS